MNSKNRNNPVALDALARELEETYAPRRPVDFDTQARATDFAPPMVRRQVEAENVTYERTADVTKQFDDIVASLEAKAATIKEEGLSARNVFIEKTTDLITRAKALEEEMDFATKGLRELRERGSKLATSAMLGPEPVPDGHG